MFKVGDKVRRKPEHQASNWLLGDQICTVSKVYQDGETFMIAESSAPSWDLDRFDLVRPISPQYSTITRKDVGPYHVTVVRKTSQILIGAYEEAGHVLSDVNTVLQECQEDYHDPEMGHEDMLERLRDRLVEIEGVTQINIVGVNDGCGVRISLEG